MAASLTSRILNLPLYHAFHGQPWEAHHQRQSLQRAKHVAEGGCWLEEFLIGRGPMKIWLWTFLCFNVNDCFFVWVISTLQQNYEFCSAGVLYGLCLKCTSKLSN